MYKLFARGQTEGIFQFESSGMKQMLTNLKPTCLEHLIAATSLYRPGPAKQIDTFIENSHHPEKIKYATELLEPILKDTFGCVVYQEQVMQIFRVLAGYSYGRADVVRRAMSKKKKDVMEAERKTFVEGCGKNNISAETANAIIMPIINIRPPIFGVPCFFLCQAGPISKIVCPNLSLCSHGIITKPSPPVIANASTALTATAAVTLIKIPTFYY